MTEQQRFLDLTFGGLHLNCLNEAGNEEGTKGRRAGEGGGGLTATHVGTRSHLLRTKMRCL